MEKEHKKRVKEFFETHPKEQEGILFSDGQIFLTKHKQYALQFEKQSGLKNMVITRQESVVDTCVDSSCKHEEKTVKELTTHAEGLGIEIPKRATKADIIELIKAKDGQLPTPADEAPESNEKEAHEEDYTPVKQD